MLMMGRDNQEEETNALVLLGFVYMAWGRFLKYPTNLPADKNPQVNEPGMHWVRRLRGLASLACLNY